MARLSAAILALSAAGCSSSVVTVLVDIPAEADRVALLAESGSQTFRFATPIHGIGPEGTTRIELDDVELEGAIVYALAWRTGDLDNIPVGGRPIRRAGALDPRLPPPMFAARGAGESEPLALAPIVTAADIPEITADQLDACPRRVTAETALDVRCGAIPCAATLSQSGCTLQLDAASCLLGSLSGRIDVSGKAHLERSSGFGPCTETSTETEVAISLECARGDSKACRVQLVSTENLDLPFADARLVPLTPVAAAPIPPVETFIPGFLSGLVAGPSRVFVSGTPSHATDVRCSGVPSAVWIVDPSTLAVETATAPDCLATMAPDPRGDGFYGAFGDAGRQRLGRFDGRAKLIDEVALPQSDRVVTRLATSPVSDKVFVAMSAADDLDAQVVAYSLGDLRMAYATDPRGKTLSDLHVLEPDKIVALDSAKGRAAQFEGGEFRFEAPLNLACGLMSADPLRMLPLDDPERWVMTAIGVSAEVLALTQDARAACEAAALYAMHGEPWALVRWPDAGGDKVLISVQTPEGAPVVTLYDARRARFLPRRMAIDARGPITELVGFGGQVFGILPATGSLVRLTPR